MTDTGNARIERIRTRLAKEVEDGAFYEAQQTYKSTFVRLKSKGDIENGVRILKDGVEQQLKFQQLGCGSELLQMLAQAHLDSQTPAAGPELQTMKELIQKCAAVEGHDVAFVTQEVRRCAGLALKWSKQCGSPDATCELLSIAGQAVFRVGGSNALGEATLYLCISNDMAAFARAIKVCTQKGRADEHDLFIARAMLQVLAAATKDTTQRQLEATQRLRQAMKCKDTPMDNFNALLLTALRRSSPALFDAAINEYSAITARDEAFADLLGRIDNVYLGRGGGGGGLGALLGSLFGG